MRIRLRLVKWMDGQALLGLGFDRDEWCGELHLVKWIFKLKLRELGGVRI